MITSAELVLIMEIELVHLLLEMVLMNTFWQLNAVKMMTLIWMECVLISAWAVYNLGQKLSDLLLTLSVLLILIVDTNEALDFSMKRKESLRLKEFLQEGYACIMFMKQQEDLMIERTTWEPQISGLSFYKSLKMHSLLEFSQEQMTQMMSLTQVSSN